MTWPRHIYRRPAHRHLRGIPSNKLLAGGLRLRGVGSEVAHRARMLSADALDRTKFIDISYRYVLFALLLWLRNRLLA